MTAQADTHFCKLIAAQLAEVELALSAASTNAATVMLDQTSVGRLSRMDAMQQQALAVGQRGLLQRRQMQLQAAMKRLQDGSFGICCEFGDDIALPRLEADPGTPFCAACQAERE